MPTSKQARSAQARQKDRLAANAAAKAARRRRRNALIAAGIIVLVVVVTIGAALGTGLGGSSTASSTATTTPTTAATLASAKGKPCVAMKGEPPAGEPRVPVVTGPPSTKLVTKDLKIGTGPVVTNQMTNVSVDYIGVACSTGEVFDSGTFPLNIKEGGVIPGWLQGIPGMKVGGSRLLEIPPALGYGSDGSPPKIAPDETLFFVVNVKSAS